MVLDRNVSLYRSWSESRAKSQRSGNSPRWLFPRYFRQAPARTLAYPREPSQCTQCYIIHNRFPHFFSTTWISEVCRRVGPAVRRTGAERAGELTATVAELALTAARRAPPPAATRPSDSLGWPDGPRGTLAAPGFPFYFSRENLAYPTNAYTSTARECRREIPRRSSRIRYSEVPRLVGTRSSLLAVYCA